MDTLPPGLDSESLLLQLYQELRRLARARMRRLPPGHTLQPTALVHEAYLRLKRNQDRSWSGCAHFFGAAAQAMRDILVEYARRKAAYKRGGGNVRVTLDPFEDKNGALNRSHENVLALDRALERLKEKYPDLVEIVLLRYFCDFTVEEIADMYEVNARTIERKWRFARAWLNKYLGGGFE